MYWSEPKRLRKKHGKRHGDLYSWGFGEMGQLANGKAADEPMPKLVEAVELEGGAVVTAASGGQHSAIVVMQA